MSRKTNETFLDEVHTLTQGEYTPLEPYISCKTHIYMRHNSNYCDNHKWSVRPDKFLYQNRRCPICNKRNRAKSHDTFVEEVYQLCGNEFSILSRYHNNKQKIAIRHNSPVCNFHVSYRSPNNFLCRPSCSKCSHSSSTSFAEQYIYLIMKKIIPETENSVRFGNRECDIYIPSLKIGIQYDGAYYHQETSKDISFNLNYS